MQCLVACVEQKLVQLETGNDIYEKNHIASKCRRAASIGMKENDNRAHGSERSKKKKTQAKLKKNAEKIQFIRSQAKGETCDKQIVHNFAFLPSFD